MVDTQTDSREYAMFMDMLVSMGVTLREIPLDKLLNSVVRATTVGPILDPTAFASGARSLQQQERLLRAFASLRKVFDDIEAEISGARRA